MMSSFLDFPEHDESTRIKDCESLRDILLFRLELHLAFLAELAEGEKDERDETWTDDCSSAVLQFGFKGAHVDRGLVSASALRFLSRDAKQLKTLAARIDDEASELFFEGIETVIDEGSIERLDLSTLLQEIWFDYQASQELNPDCLPTIESDKDGRVTHARIERQPGSIVLTYDLRVLGTERLALRWRKRCWGKLEVVRASKTRTRVDAATGVFLQGKIERELELAAAAKSESTSHDASRLSVEAIEDGIQVGLVVSQDHGAS